ncbi:methyltransferase domain-containing protein [Fragilaria crotonensis]|nr:methyltransferase domain-containing protein [Fragilaria crotonensis]
MGNVLLWPLRRCRSFVYDSLILKLTTKWYEVVLSRLDEGSTLLDVGIGTAGALVRCKDILLDRQIRVVGIDYDADYIAKAHDTISRAGLDHLVSVIEMSVYQLDAPPPPRKQLSASSGREYIDSSGQPLQATTPLLKPNSFDAVYFSGSFSLLPDPPLALNAVLPFLRQRDGQIYITQTYQRYTPPLLAYVKPLLRYITTIDFGKLIPEEEAATFFHQVVPTECKLQCIEHEVIRGSVDTFLQAAYLTVLRPRSK